MHTRSDDEVFCTALEQNTATEQEEWVKSFCGDNVEQAERVLNLLRVHRGFDQNQESMTPLLDRADEVFRAFSANENLEIGEFVGPYRLVQKIGEGGVGVVFQAKQESPVKREVAVKLLKPGMDSRRILARFALERQVLERMEHPGITRILDAGVQENGRPFFAMELVRNAVPITAYAEDKQLSVRQCVELMAAVCDIVQYAHQRAVIHRDLKPTNILLCADSPSSQNPKVIDFGIAKVAQEDTLDSPGLTLAGERFGTPQYMSPEALNSPGDIDIRSDVYSLGVVLFELFTGRLPGEGKDRAGRESWTLGRVNSSDVGRPSQVVAPSHEARKEALEGELDWITIKALQANPAERYQTVADLRRDLEHFLKGLPVEAVAPSWSYRLRKFLARNQVLAATSGLIAFILLTTTVATSCFAIWAMRAEAKASERLQEVVAIQGELRTERDKANEARRQAEGVLRVFQVQSASSRALSKYYLQVLDFYGKKEDRVTAIANLQEQFDSSRLLEGHERLIVRGDWSWADDMFPDLIFRSGIHLSSKEAAKTLAPPNERDPQPSDNVEQREPTELAGKEDESELAASAPNIHRQLLLELKEVVGHEDPFVAEVLDNSGLSAIELADFERARNELRESARIWGLSGKYPANEAQSRLFHAEALIALEQFGEARNEVGRARSLIDSLDRSSTGFQPLREYAQDLSTQLTLVVESQTP